MSIMMGVIYCEHQLNIKLTNLNPESIVVDNNSSPFHCRIANLNYFVWCNQIKHQSINDLRVRLD